jgi:hypothetical protein
MLFNGVLIYECGAHKFIKKKHQWPYPHGAPPSSPSWLRSSFLAHLAASSLPLLGQLLLTMRWPARHGSVCASPSHAGPLRRRRTCPCAEVACHDASRWRRLGLARRRASMLAYSCSMAQQRSPSSLCRHRGGSGASRGALRLLVPLPPVCHGKCGPSCCSSAGERLGLPQWSCDASWSSTGGLSSLLVACWLRSVATQAWGGGGDDLSLGR